MPGPPFIGLTGGIGAGKSAALAAFERLGAATLSTDAVVHDLYRSPELRELMIARWGDEVAPDGHVDRDRIAAVVFDSPEELAWLERELHPRVGQVVVEWRRSLAPEVPIAVVEVPLLFESGMEPVFDAVVCVVADDAERARRTGARGHEGLEGRGERQLSQEEKAARSDYVVHNDGTLEELEAELGRLMPELRAATR